jgi:hypothetical protein
MRINHNDNWLVASGFKSPRVARLGPVMIRKQELPAVERLYRGFRSVQISRGETSAVESATATGAVGPIGTNTIKVTRRSPLAIVTTHRTSPLGVVTEPIPLGHPPRCGVGSTVPRQVPLPARRWRHNLSIPVGCFYRE